MGFICTRSLPVLSGWSVTSCWGLYVPEAYLSCQGGLSRPVGVYMYQKLTCPVRVVCHALLGFICTRSLPVLSGWSVTSCCGLYVQKLTCPVRVVCHVLLGFICTRSLPVLSGWSVMPCWGLYVPEAYLSCQGGLSCLVGVYMYQKLTCPVRVVCHALLGFICTRSLPVLSGRSVMSCCGLYVLETY